MGPDFTDVFCIFDVCYFFAKIFGMAPYEKLTNRRGRFYESQKISFGNLTIILGSLYSYGIYWLFTNDILNKTAPFNKKLVVTMFVSLGIAALIATTTFLFTHNCFIKSFQLIKRVDQVLLEWQLDFSYHKEYLIVLILTFTIPLLGVISELTIPNHQSRNFARRFCESICFGFGMVTRSYVFIFLSFGFNIISRQFKNLNETLIKMGCRNGDIFNKELKESNVETLLKLKMVVKLHATLCIAAKNLNRSLQIPLLVNIFFNFMIMSFIIVGCSRGRSDPSVSYWEYFAHTASLQAPLIFVLSRAEEVNYEMKNFLLLTLHNKIRLKVCGCYPLNFSVITNHFEHCCTLIIFLLKMNK